MEIFLIIIFSIAARFIWRAMRAAGKASQDVRAGESDSFAESFSAQFGGFGEFQSKVEESTKTFSPEGTSEELTLEIFEVKVKGIIPVSSENTGIEVVTHILDTTEEDPLPVASVHGAFQELSSHAFECRSPRFQVPLESGWATWTSVFAIPKDFLHLPHKGLRILSFRTLLISADNPPRFKYGFVVEEGVHYGGSTQEISFNYDQLGYNDESANKQEIEELTIMLAYGVAASDGSVDLAEGEIVKEWVTERLAYVPESDLKDEKKQFNDAIRKAHQQMSAEGGIEVAEICNRFNEVGSEQNKYEALELCMDVLKADKRADPSELKLMDTITEALQLDPEKYRRLRDRSIVEVGGLDIEKEGDLESALGITAAMGEEEIQSHLISEFAKWNSRVTTGDEETRLQAERMLTYIAEARLKYSSSR